MNLNKMFGKTPLEVEAEENKVLKKYGIPGHKEETPEQQNKELVKMFRNVFSTPNGKIVLGVILEDLYYFKQCKNDEDRALNNYAKALIQTRLGINDNYNFIDHILSD